MPQTCIAEEFLWCYEPANGHDKVYISRVYERDDGKFVHSTRWGRRFSTLSPKDEVMSSRGAALSAHDQKVSEKRSGRRSRYDRCTAADIGVTVELVQAQRPPLVVPQSPPTPFPGPQPPLASHPSRLRPQPVQPAPAPAPASTWETPTLPPGGNRFIDWDD